MTVPIGSPEADADATAVGMATPTTLAELLRIQRDACLEIGSALYGRLIERSIDRLDVPGPIRELLAPHAGDPFGSALALRFLGAVHRLVLEGAAPELAGHYPSVGGRPGRGLEDVFEAIVASHLDRLAVDINRGVQTNEVGRAVPLMGALLGLAELGFPLRVFEIGASAGLNLRWDHFRYQAGTSSFGDPSSPVRFADPWVDRRPRLDVPVEVIARVGCDRAPVDATTDQGRLTLRSFVWPDLIGRLQRLDAAIEVARRVPAPVHTAEARAWVTDRLGEPVAGTATAIMHSIVLQYLAPAERRELLASIAAAGARATRQAPLAWIRMEPGRQGAETRLTLWPGGSERLLSISSYHGPPVRWL